MNSFKIILGGNIAAQLVALVSYTWIARRYSTEDFGFAAFLISATFICSIIQSGQIYWALFTIRDEQKQTECYEDSIRFLLMMTPIMMVLCFPLVFFSFNRLGWYILLVPIFTFSYSLIEINKVYSNGIGNHKESASQVFFSRSYGQLLKIVFSFFKTSGPVLVFSELIANLYVGIKGARLKNIASNLKPNFEIFRKYKKHIQYYAPLNFLNLAIQEAPVILSTYYFGMAASGAFFLISRLIINPVTMIGNSFANAQIKKINSYNSSPASKRKFLLKSYVLLILVGVIPSIVLFFYGKQLFEIFLGNSHEEANLLIKSIAILIPFRLVKAMTVVSSINADVYAPNLLIKGLLLVAIICVPFFMDRITYNGVVIAILSLESLTDLILAFLSFKRS